MNKISQGRDTARRWLTKILKQISADADNRSFDCGSADINANGQRAASVRTSQVFTHNVCALYALCAMLLGNTAMAADAGTPLVTISPHEAREPRIIRA